jgi:hypothetical protein
MKLKRHLYSLAALLILASGTAQAGAVLTLGAGVGSVQLGVNNQGHLNFGPGTKNSGATGLAAFLTGDARGPGYYDSTAPGCLCEGWGVAAGGTAGYANVATDGVVNLTVDSFTSTATTAVSAVHLTSLAGLKVTHDYHAAAGSPLNTFESTVTIENTTAGTLTNLLYRRVMDWDVPYTEFSEAVTIQGWPATALKQTTDNGFATANPLGGAGTIACPANVNFVDCAPGADHGALFDFTFGDLAAGETKTFKIFYGAALSETAAIAALAAVGAEVYSLGQSDTSGGDPILGIPATYFFGFAGVGGTPVAPVPEPTSLLLLIPAAAYTLRRKFQKAA